MCVGGQGGEIKLGLDGTPDHGDVAVSTSHQTHNWILTAYTPMLSSIAGLNRGRPT